MKISFHDLPVDVRQHLAKILLSSAQRTAVDDIYLKDNENLTTLLSYSQVDDTYRRAVMEAMGDMISPYPWSLITLNEWVSTFHELLFEINLLKSQNIKLQPGLLRRLPNLRKATIIGIPDQLSAICRCPKMTELSVRIHSLSIWGQLVWIIRSLPLKNLRLDVDIIYKMAKLENMPRSELLRLSAACHNVEHLELPGCIMLTPNLCSTFDAFRSLKKIGLKAKIGSHHLNVLRKFSEVDLYEPSIRIATGVGTSLVGVTMRNKTSEDIAKLSACPHLRRLSVSLHENAEADLVGVINNVEDLFLKWNFTYTAPDPQVLNGGLASMPNLRYPKYYGPNGAVLASIVSSTRRLKSLMLENAIVKGETVGKLLENAGRYLENINFNVDWQLEPAVPRLHLILITISRHCPNLRTLHLLEDIRCVGHTPIFATTPSYCK